jgi:hypothetical protein
MLKPSRLTPRGIRASLRYKTTSSTDAMTGWSTTPSTSCTWMASTHALRPWSSGSECCNPFWLKQPQCLRSSSTASTSRMAWTYSGGRLQWAWKELYRNALMLHTALVEANSGLFLVGRPAYRCRSGTRQRLPSLGQRGAQVPASNMSLRQLSPPASAGGTSYKERCEECSGRRRRDLGTQYFFDHIFLYRCGQNLPYKFSDP